MADFAVWAPNAQSSVQVEVNGRRHPMKAAPGNWYRATVPDAAPGDRYAFVIDNGPPLPDPRSPFQPDGPMRKSQLVDHAAFNWTDRKWSAPSLSGAVFYELHVGTFTPGGTFEAAIERLDYLAELGITHVELMPVAETPGTRNWGYDGVSLFAPHHALGGPQGLKKLIDACHARGLAVFIDVVYNHLGPSGNFLPQYGPYFDDHVSTLWGDAVNLAGPHSDEVRRFFIDNALMWLRDYHADGLRFDAVHAFYDPGAMHILEELAIEVDALQAHLRRTLSLVAESDLNDPRIVRSIDAGGYGIEAQWSDDFHHALHAWLTGESSGYYSGFGNVAHLALALKNAYVYAGSYCPYRSRRHGRPAAGLSAHCFLGYIQNHDQIGNRCLGERIGHLVSFDRARIAAALMLTSPFIPLIFMGEEWAASSPFQYFTSHEDAEIAEATRNGRRKEFVSFGWNADDVPDPQDVETFNRSRLRWDEIDRPPHAEMLRWYRRLIALRRSTPALTDGRLDCLITRYDSRENWIAVHRGPLTIAANLGPDAVSIDTRPSAHSNVHPSARRGTQIPADIAAISAAPCRSVGSLVNGAASPEAPPSESPESPTSPPPSESSSPPPAILLRSSADVQLDGTTLHLPPDSLAIVSAEGAVDA